MSLRGGGRFHGSAGGAGEGWRRGARISGGEGAADGDGGGCLAGGDLASGGGECLAGLGFVVAVPVPVDGEAASAQVTEGVVVAGGGNGGGEAGGGGAVAG